MPTILFLPSAVGKSHTARLLLIAQALQQQYSYNIVVGISVAHEHLLNTYQFKTIQIPDIDYKGNFDDNIFAHYSTAIIKNIVAAECNIIKNIQPIAIVADFRPTARISACIQKIPLIAIANAYMTNYFNPITVLMPQLKSNSLTFKFISWISTMIQNKQKKQLAKNFREVAKANNIQQLSSLYDFLNGDMTLIADLPDFCPLPNLPNHFQYIGALDWNAQKNEAIPPILPHKPLIYVSIGNTGNIALLQTAIKAFAKQEKYQVIITTGHYQAIINEQQYPHIFIYKNVNGDAVMQKSVLAIHCGGNGTTYQAMRHGIPSIVVPYNNDQLINAHLIQKNEVGIALKKEAITTEILWQTVLYMEQKRKNMPQLSHFKHLLAQTDAPATAAQKIHQFLQ